MFIFVGDEDDPIFVIKEFLKFGVGCFEVHHASDLLDVLVPEFAYVVQSVVSK